MKRHLIRSFMTLRIFLLLVLFADELALADIDAAGPPARLAVAGRLTAADAPRERVGEHALPDAGLLERRRGTRRAASTLATPRSEVPRVVDLDLTDAARGGGQGRAVDLRDGTRAELARLTDLLRAREARGEGAAVVRSAERDAPWTDAHLLGNPTHMADQYVSLQRSVDGRLYAVWQANDLGGTDRDIHIGWSTDDGASWDVAELPSFDQDEYHPELAVDAAGYLFVTWIRSDGAILRARSATPGSTLSWAWVRGLVSGETHATPCIAVSGSGSYAKVFICAAWSTINYDLYQYEWTLIWFYSTTGGEIGDYDYFEPDGYPDYWPDAEMDGATVYLLNSEKDYQTGVMQVVAADGPIGGVFNDPWYLTSWTNFDCQFPSLTALGQNVFAVFQMEYDDGLGNTDGDVVFCYSDDGLASMYGPYEMVTDDFDSVGPVLYGRDGTVGCLWLDAAPGEDEYMLCARQAGGGGHPDNWGDIETILSDKYVDPSFRTAAGAVGAHGLHAAWSDRRDYPTQNLNIYTSERLVLPNLAPCAPSGWEASLVVNHTVGERANSLLQAGETAYVSFAFTNDGMTDIEDSFLLRLLVDGEQAAEWELSGALSPGYFSAVEDYPVILAEGSHVIRAELDHTDLIVEEDETDNLFGGAFAVIDGEPRLRLDPAQVTHVFEARGGLDASAPIPLVDRVSLPVIGERLAAAMSAAGAGEKLRVMVQPRRQVDAVALGGQLAGSTRAERTAHVAAALKRNLAANRALLDDRLNDLAARGEADAPEELWLPGLLLVEMTPAAAVELARDPNVGALWLDDVRSETFAEPSETEVAGDRSNAWHLTKIGAPAAWAQGYDGEGVLIGHLDSGVAWDHPDLAAGLWDGGAAWPHHGWDCLDEDDDPYDGDTEFYHGTHTAGCIIGDGALGTTCGAAPGAKLIALRCVPGYFADFVEGLQFCLERGTPVINASAGWTDPPVELKEANRSNADVLASAGIVWVCAAGNGDNAGGHLSAPHDIATPGDVPHPFYGDAGHSAVISVGASTSADQMNALSSEGPTWWDDTATPGFNDYPYPPGLMKPDLTAPGQSITSTTPGGYVAYDGTSMATPLASAACAILLQACPGLPLADLAETLENSVVDIMAPGRDNNSGAGRLYIPAALAQLPDGAWESFDVVNDGELPLAVTGFTGVESWFQIGPLDAVIQPGERRTFTVVYDEEPLPQGLTTAEVLVHSNDPAGPRTLTVVAIVGVLTGVAEDEPVAAPSAELTNWPNPFNPKTVIRFVNPTPGPVRLSIHDTRGRLLRTLADGELPAGAREFVWDGRDADGRPAVSGVYFARVTTEAGALSRKLVMLK